MWRRSLIGTLALASIGAAVVTATPCGTLAAPTACSVTVGGTTTFTFSNFNFSSSSSSGGGTFYFGSDVDIDVAAGTGLTALLTFSKNGATTGSAFQAGAGQTAAFAFFYDVTLSSTLGGAVAYGSPFVVAIPQSSQSGNSFGSAKLFITNVGNCQAVVGVGDGICAIPGGQPATLQARNEVTLTGMAGTVGIGSFTNLVAAHSEGRFYSMPPCRVLDTRSAPIGGGPFAHEETRTYGFGACPLPVTARAVALNVTAVDASGGGQFNLFSADLDGTSTLVLGFRAGLNRANNAVVALSELQDLIRAQALLPEGGGVQLVIDINGYFE